MRAHDFLTEAPLTPGNLFDPRHLSWRPQALIAKLEAGTPFFDKDENRWLIGISISPPRVTTKKLAVTAAVAASIGENKEVVVMTVRAIAGMVRGKVSAKSVSGWVRPLC